MPPLSVGDASLDVVILGARESLDETSAAAIGRLFGAGVDTARVRELALLHKTFPLLAMSLGHDGLSGVPGVAELRLELQRYAVGAAIRRRSKLAPVLTELIDVFERGEIPHIFMRGERFAQRFYSAVDLRVSEDIDVLVPERLREEAVEALLARGYTFLIADPVLRGAYAWCMGQVEMKHPETGTWVDLNWMLTGNCGIGHVLTDMDGVWARARRETGFEYTMCPEDELLELIRHVGHGHDFQQALIKTCGDVDAMLSVTQVDWQLFLDLAARVECVEIGRMFAWFHDRHYATAGAVGLLEKVGARAGGVHDAERRLFCSLVMLPALRLAPRAKERLGAYALELLSWVCKFWSLDRLRRLRVLIMQMMLWPPTVAVLGLTHPIERCPVLVRRLLIWTKCLTLLPAAITGAALRLAGAVWR